MGLVANVHRLHSHVCQPQDSSVHYCFYFFFLSPVVQRSRNQQILYTFNILTKVFSTIENIQHLLLYSFYISADLFSACNERDDGFFSHFKTKKGVKSN